MSSSLISLYDVFNAESIVTRSAATTLLDYISRAPGTNIVLDFEKIRYISRSFFDELYSYERKIQLLGKKLEFTNLSDSLTSLKELVERTNSTNSFSYYSSAINAQVLNV
ncbi:MAG: DUF4325 domain-containing protein [Bacteroidales bacterium]|nr:DUF4325 domain-containing protein [Bacteroidales bacterium]